MQLHNLPLELRQRPQWVCFRFERSPTGKITKPPCSAHTGLGCNVGDPASWGTLEQAQATAARLGLPGVGYANSPDDPFTIIDLDDHEHAPIDDVTRAWHNSILQHFASYTERSVSGRGYHIIVRGKVPTKTERSNVGLYSASGSYVVCTGDVVRAAPVMDFSTDLAKLYEGMQTQTVVVSPYESQEQHASDSEIARRASTAANGAKFLALARGEFVSRKEGNPSSEFPSQSEIDLALLSMLCFYSKNNEQVQRLYFRTVPGQRAKARYNFTRDIARARSTEQPQVDVSQLLATSVAQVEAIQSQSAAPATAVDTDDAETFPFPHGLVGDIAHYIYESARQPVRSVALSSALAVCCGIAGRSWHFNGTGLNQYIILLGGTGIGKEDGTSGIGRMMKSLKQDGVLELAQFDKFIGPGSFASAPSITKTIAEQPSMVAILNEFGDKLKGWNDPRASESIKQIRGVLLDLWNKSGPNQSQLVLAYSDRDKNTKAIESPALSLYGDSTPEKFYAQLNPNDIGDGFVPRLLVIEYKGGLLDEREDDEAAGAMPPRELADRFRTLAMSALSMQTNNVRSTVQRDEEGGAMLKAFRRECRDIMRRGEFFAQVWGRTAQKAYRLAGLLAVGVDPHRPTVTAKEAAWAIAFARMTTHNIEARFDAGDTGTGDSKQLADLRKIIRSYFANETSIPNEETLMRNAGCIAYRYLNHRAGRRASFYSDKLGATQALFRSLRTLVDGGELELISSEDTYKRWGSRAKVYALGKAFT